MQAETLKNQVWAWLFTRGYTSRTVPTPTGATVTQGISRQDADRITDSFIGPAVSTFLAAADWEFAQDEATFSTVANTAEYICRGNVDDCGEIINVRVGAGRGLVIERLDVLQTDRREGEDEDVGDQSDYGDIYGYTLFGRSDDGFPVIQIFDTPQEIKTVRYRYRKRNLGIGDVPEEYAFVIRDLVLAQYEPQFEAIARDRMNQAIDAHKRGGDEYETIRLDPDVEAGNVRRSNSLPGGF